MQSSVTLRSSPANNNMSTNLLYASNFGNQPTTGQEANVNIESVMFECILKPLIKRLIELKFESINQENLVSKTINNTVYPCLMSRSVLLNKSGLPKSAKSRDLFTY